MNNNEGRKIILDDKINADEQDNFEYGRNMQLNDEHNIQEEYSEVEPKKSSGLFHVEKSERKSEGKKISAPVIVAVIIFGAIIMYIIVLLLTGSLFEKKVKIPFAKISSSIFNISSQKNLKGILPSEFLAYIKYLSNVLLLCSTNSFISELGIIFSFPNKFPIF